MIKIRKIYGGPAAIRTQDLTVISRALHQAKLRARNEVQYGYKNLKILLRKDYRIMVGPLRFERRTSRLSAVRSTKLSYGPEMSSFLELSKLKGFFGKASQSDNNSNTRFTTYNFCLNRLYFEIPKIYLQDAEPVWRQLYIRYRAYEGC
jgi:hypothetical protein